MNYRIFAIWKIKIEWSSALSNISWAWHTKASPQIPELGLF